MRCGLGTANKHPNSKRPGQDLMSEIGSHPVWKVIIIVIMIIIIIIYWLYLSVSTEWLFNCFRCYFIRPSSFFSLFSVV